MEHKGLSRSGPCWDHRSLKDISLASLNLNLVRGPSRNSAAFLRQRVVPSAFVSHHRVLIDVGSVVSLTNDRYLIESIESVRGSGITLPS